MNTGDDATRLAAEARARVLIDRQLTDAGWSVQDSRTLNIFAAQGVARREATMATGHGESTTCSTSTNASWV
jgi:type I restriction enzyme R subunit